MQDKTTEMIQMRENNVSTTLDKIAPKFCTTINIGVLNTKNLVLSLLYQEDKHLQKNAALMERVVIDIEHAKSLRNVLSEILKDIENENDKYMVK